jgi:hypothetical protein
VHGDRPTLGDEPGQVIIWIEAHIPRYAGADDEIVGHGWGAIDQEMCIAITGLKSDAHSRAEEALPVVQD